MSNPAAQPLWDPTQYSRFEAERDRAALDLLLRLPGELEPRTIVDLGCGTGQHAALLKRRHPQAHVTGLDSNAAMLEQARTLGADVDWVQADLATWTPEVAPDLIFANASLQWLPEHRALLGRLAGLLAPGGVIAVQMPLAWDTLHYRTMRAVRTQGPWAERLSDRDSVQALLDPADYYDVLAESCEAVDIWSTTYLHALTGPDAVLEWMKGTALRPYLTALADDPAMRSAWLSASGDALSRAFPRRPDGVTLLPFPRLFLIARKRSDDDAGR
ncbi:MAG: methyltransferase domain-containing protein [Rubrivivax sp.]|nr:MAG: methyltransferase domain-containing protein [Rubrivivax sp.]